MAEYEYREYVDNLGVKRASTDRLYLLQIPKESAVEKIDAELKSLEFAGLYLLIDSVKNLIYTGESSNIKDRIQQHVKKSDVDSLKQFDTVIVIWDGRPIMTTRFGNETLRKSLEKDCINVFDPKFSKYTSVNIVKEPKETNICEQTSSNKLKDELYVLFNKFNLIHTIPSK